MACRMQGGPGGGDPLVPDPETPDIGAELSSSGSSMHNASDDQSEAESFKSEETSLLDLGTDQRD